MTVKFFRNLHCFKGGGGFSSGCLFFAIIILFSFLALHLYFSSFSRFTTFFSVFNSFSYSFLLFFLSFLFEEFFFLHLLVFFPSCLMPNVSPSVSTTMVWTNNLIMQWSWEWTKVFDSWGWFLESAENFLGPRSQLANCNLLWLKSWSLSMFYMKGKPRGSWSLMASNHGIVKI